jgi:hypothetical protein
MHGSMGRDEQVEVTDLHGKILEFQLLDTLQELEETRGKGEDVVLWRAAPLTFFVRHGAHLPVPEV